MTSDPRALGGSSNHRFANWARTYTCEAEAYFEPKTTEEIQKILSCAQQRGKRVKVVGQGHSPSDLACTTDYMISLKKYNKLIKADKEKCQVTVEGGMLLSELIQSVLVPNGMALSVQGSISDLSIAGTISTGTHGSGKDFGIMSSYVVGMQLMLASGEVLVVSPEENTDLFPAALCSLGSFGVILTVTLQCEPAYKLHQKTYPAKLDDVLQHLQVHVSASDHFRFLWFPHTDNVVVSHVSRTNMDASNKSSWFWDYGVGYYLLELCLWISTFFPRLVTTINRRFFKHVYSRVQEKVDRSDVIFSFECLFKQYVMEWAIPRESTAWVLKELQSWIERTGFPAHLPVEVRFVKQDDIYLSPAYGRESCYINIIMYRPYGKLVATADYWDEFERIVTKVGGRPHWAKDHKVGPEQFRQLYPHWDTFCQIRKRLDPNGRFLNNYLERVFGTD